MNAAKAIANPSRISKATYWKRKIDLPARAKELVAEGTYRHHAHAMRHMTMKTRTQRHELRGEVRAVRRAARQHILDSAS
jgi:hypothetical protein